MESETERLNDRRIRAIEAPPSGYKLIRDGEIPGFGIRVTANGARSFVLTYLIDGRQRRLTIGKWPAWTATAARERAKELRREIDRGIDPLGEKQERRAEPTFGDLAAEYLKRHAIKKKTGQRDRQYLANDVLPQWRNRKACDIRRRDIIRLIEEKAQHAPIASNRLLALLRKMFNWAISVELLEANPCVQVKAPATETQRDRVLSEEEIRVVWNGLESAQMGDDVARILRLILITAQRPGEVAALEWAEIDGTWWTIPAQKAKNKLAHRVPLSRLAVAELDAVRKREPWVFPSPRGQKSIQVNALAHAVRRCQFLGLPHWTPHDLRRTAASAMASAGVARLVISKILNHKEQGVTAIYERHSYDLEKQAAMTAWERRLRAILGRAEKTEVVELVR